MQGRRRATAWCGRLLLFAALLLGIVTMHTFGHPSAHASSHASSDVVSAHDSPPAHGTGHHESKDKGKHDGGMDPMSVCLAVLGAAGWAAALLLVALVVSRRPVITARAWFSRALWPVPPPPRHKALARLSVLRV